MAASEAGRDMCILPSTNVSPRVFITSIMDWAWDTIVPLGVTSIAKYGDPR